MLVTDENKEYYLQAVKVSFLTEPWEVEWYTAALMRAAAWGRKIDRQNKEYRMKNHLTEKYNH